MRVGLLDETQHVVVGPPWMKSTNTITRPIVVDNRAVGWVALIPFEHATAQADVRFQQEQLQATWIIGLSLFFLAAVVSMSLARWLLAPIKHIAQATHSLATGDYSTRVAIRSRDEVGRLADDFNRLALALERTEKLRRSFMADMSHELRTPLAILRGEIEAMQDSVRPLSVEALKSLQSEVGVLQKLVDDLYDLSLSDAGALTYRKEEIDITEVLKDTVDAFRQRLAEHELTLGLWIPEERFIVLADEGRLRQLFSNLMENAIRYTNRNGHVEIRCYRVADTVVVDFQDSAPGIAPDLLPRLFERFYRVDESRSRALGGAGLGLAICRNIIEAHGGNIVAQVSPLGGLRLTIALPQSHA